MSADHSRTGPGATTWAGLAVVALAAAILSFTALRDLAAACGIEGTFLLVPVAWLLPVAIDAAAVVATRLWLTLPPEHPAREAARAVALAGLGLSVAGNAAQHGLTAYGLTPPWWAVVLVSAVPPVALAAVAHLAALVGRTASASSPDAVLERVEVPVSAASEPAGNEPEDLPSRIAALVEQAERQGERPPGRRRIAAALGTTEHAVRAAAEHLALDGVAR